QARMIFTRDAIGSFVDLPFMALHLSMVVFLCRQRRKDPLLRNAFFTIYIILSVADLAIMFGVS
ncbi:hypothetical protein AAVH_41686, partial [Aphelenchoides avenae]